MGMARNTFYVEIQGTGNVLVVPAWDRGLTHPLVGMLSVEKKKETDSAHKYQTWQHKAVPACAGLHTGASACLVSATVSYMGGRRTSISPINSPIDKSMRGKNVLFWFFCFYILLFGQIFEMDEVNQ